MLEIVAAPEVDEDFLSLVLAHVKVEEGEEETAYGDLVAAYLDAALARVEAMSGRLLFKRTLRYTADTFGAALELPVSPVISIDSASYVDRDGVTQTLAGSAYALVNRMDQPALYPVPGTAWPATQAFPGAVIVEFDAGYGEDMEDIPAPLRQAVMMTVADWFRFGGNVAATSIMELPESAYRACLSYRREWT